MEILYYVNNETNSLLVTTEEKDHMHYIKINKKDFLKYKKAGYAIITSAEMDFDLCLKMFSPTFKEKIINIIKKAIQNEYIIAEKRTDNKYTISVIDNNFKLVL
ncbi:hypothetical protein FDF97_18820 [Clostridium botulinum]|uniref:Uncharacterized protein n=1 Tax=Clostridium botulinum TaxID=1491 RepID=A0AA44BSR4_CLOBO|nr:hypothetical protein [Clostridium botulinum]NFI23361.1 hypothetical protein [Clostridium botulinum]NFQ80224.1 hypothetical protein [Clostridium botulinum]